MKIPVDVVVKLDNGNFVTDNMYVYEGHDYSKEKPEADNDAFEKCLEGEPDLTTEYICTRKQILTQFLFLFRLAQFRDKWTRISRETAGTCVSRALVFFICYAR